MVFDQVDGEIGPGLLDDIEGLFRTLVRLHRAPVPGLCAFDPFLRIRPRRHLAIAGPLRKVLDEPVPKGAATLHGDLHVGQFIRDGAGKAWIVDLDDMALGPPEADLANFTAHLATSMSAGVGYWADRVQLVWADLGQECDPQLFTRFLRFALVRRHLKLREAGRPDFENQVMAYLRESSNFSIL